MQSRMFWVWGLVVVALVLGGAYFFWSYTQQGETGGAVVVAEAATSGGDPTVGSAAEGTNAYDALITFDGEMFEPNELTVRKGTRVRFLNESDIDVWPASAIHPTHSIYPEKDEQNCLGSSFDACRGLKKGEFFDFTFDHTGEWRYHDHLRAFKTGVVIVTE